MKQLVTKLLFGALALMIALVGPITASHQVGAANTPTLNQTITTGVLTTDVQDASQNSVASPSFTMSTKGVTFSCQSGANASTGTLGSNSQRIYVSNPSAANNGWTLTMAATSGATSAWTSGSNTFDYNDASGSGCTDGADSDTKGGQLTVSPSAASVTLDCASCSNTGITKGSNASFVEGTTDSVSLMNASSSADHVWRGYLSGVGLSQTIPAEQQSGAYSINMTLTVTAS